MTDYGFRDAVLNSTSFIPSPMDLLMTVPRLAQRAGAFAFFYLPEQLDGFLSKTISNKSLANSSSAYGSSITSPAIMSSTQPLETAEAGAFVAMGNTLWSTLNRRSVMYKISNLDSIFSYMASRWAISTFAIAIILNRTQVYASSRRRLRLNWQSRFLLRSLPVVLFVYQILLILETMRCQTSSQLFTARFKDSDKVLFGAFTGEGGPLYRLSSTLLFWQDDQGSCLAAGMVSKGEDWMDFSGSLAILWPLFMTLCLSHFVENLSCALQGKEPLAETGMTIFEHSLAFAEAEAVVRGSFGMGLFGLPKFPAASPTSTSIPSPDQAGEVTVSISAAMIMSRLNVPPEVLLISLVSSCSHLSTNILAILGLQARFRLVNTGIWGVSFMSAFFWSFVKFSRSAISQEDIGVLRYPTVCIVGFMPHFLILTGIFICGFIYSLALIITILSPPSKHYAQAPLRERIRRAHSNLQANISFSNIDISWQGEFYATLLKVGFAVLTAASEAIYFNEGATVTMSQWTWLEAQRYEEFLTKQQASRRIKAMVPTELQGSSSIAEGVGLVEEDQPNFHDGAAVLSGFARERKTTKTPSKLSSAATREDGVGGTQRSGRWIMSWTFMRAIVLLLLRFWSLLTLFCLRKLHIRNPPVWLQRLAVHDQLHRNNRTSHRKTQGRPQSLEFWMLSDSGEVSKPTNLNVDVEAETRKRFLLGEDSSMQSDEFLDDHLYDWWKSGGWWGEIDSSGDYKNRDLDDDITSVVSYSTATDTNETTFEADEDDGIRTPTQARPYIGHRDSVEPEDSRVDLAHLAELLDPKTLEHKQEARLLASHIQSSGPLTRLQYRKKVARERARILLPNGDFDWRIPTKARIGQRISEQEEEDLLEQIIRSRRPTNLPKRGRGASWDEGAEGMGNSGPQCVVCHSSPRTILVWPCRCLSLCEECRVSLAMNNFGSCVCCRRDVVAFSRLFVP